MSHSKVKEDGSCIKHSEQARYVDLFNRMEDFVFIFDPETLEIFDANPSAELGLNLTWEELRKKKISDWLHTPDAKEFERYVRIAKRNYRPKRYSAIWQLQDNSLAHFEMALCSLQVGDSEENTAIQLIARNITKEVHTQNELDKYVKKLEELSTSDELTQLANIRHFKNQLQVEHDRASRYSDKYCIVLFDADNFKHYNDRNGHPAGDGILRKLGELTKQTVRNTDLAARYGGEEFIVLLRSTEIEGGWLLAERLRMMIEEHPFPLGEFQPLGKVTVSIGVAAFPGSGTEWEEVIQAADQALYHSKKTGRNRVSTAPRIDTAEIKVIPVK